MKETLTLLERCQREARETFWEQLDADGIKKMDALIANTLKQAAEALEGMKQEIFGDPEMNLNIKKQSRNKTLTDARKVLLGELDI